MRILLLVLSCFLVAGCNTTHCRVTTPEGTICDVYNSRLAWTTGEYSVELTGVGKLSASKSSPDAETAKAIASGVVQGLSQAAGVPKLPALPNN